MIRILLAEDQALVRDGLAALLSLRDGFEVEAVADGREALERARARRPDIAILDVRMPVMDGVEATRALKELYPDLPVLVLTTFDDRRLVERSLEAGASAYLLKDIHPDDLVNAIRLLLAGERLIPGDLAREIAGKDDSGADLLTERQREVLQLIAEGLSNREIAQRLYLSEGTVKNTVSEIYARLDVRDRVQAVLKLLGGR